MKYSLLGINGNAFCVMGYVTKSMKKEGKSQQEINAFREKAMSGNYQELLGASQDIIEELNQEK